MPRSGSGIIDEYGLSARTEDTITDPDAIFGTLVTFGPKNRFHDDRFGNELPEVISGRRTRWSRPSARIEPHQAVPIL